MQEAIIGELSRYILTPEPRRGYREKKEEYSRSGRFTKPWFNKKRAIIIHHIGCGFACPVLWANFKFFFPAFADVISKFKKTSRSILKMSNIPWSENLNVAVWMSVALMVT